MSIRIQDLIDHTLSEGGGTFVSGTPTDFASGFVVGGLAPTSIVAVDDLSELVCVLHEFVNTHEVFGTWVDAGQVHVDAVQWLQDEGEALRLVKELGQIAIWDCAERKEVRL